MPESYKKVLLHIATTGPKTKYQIEKETRLSHAAVHEAIHVLSNYGQVEGKKVGTTRVGLPKTQYSLTPRGLIEAILEVEDMEKIIQKWKQVEPVIIGKWDHLVDKIGKKNTQKIIAHAASYLDWITAGSNVETFRERAIELFIREYAYELFKNKNTNPSSKQEIENLITALKTDEQLKQYAQKYITERKNNIQKELEYVQFLETKLSD